jgi:hypothetical protein
VGWDWQLIGRAKRLKKQEKNLEGSLSWTKFNQFIGSLKENEKGSKELGACA